MGGEYFYTAVDKKSRTVIVHEAISQLAKVKFDGFICRGRSGLAIGSILAYLMNKELVIVNKKEVKSHDFGPITVGPRARLSKLIFVDDFISDGDTFKACESALKAWNDEVKIVGIYLYKQDVINKTHITGDIPILNRTPRYVESYMGIISSYKND